MKKLLASFDTNSKGLSARKLTAFAFVLCAYYVHYEHVDNSNAVDALIVDACVVVMCLGIVTAEQVIKLKNGSKDDQPGN